MDSGDLLGIVAFLTIGLSVTLYVGSRSRFMAPVVAAFAVHLLIGWVVWVVLGFYVPDASVYDFVARQYVAYWDGLFSQPPDFATGKEGWVLILATIYRYFGQTPMLGIIFNATASAITTSLVMGTTDRLGWGHKAKTAGWMMLMPAFLLWSSLLLRESAAWTLAALAMWAGAGLVRKGNLFDAMWLLAAIAGSLWIRGSLASVLLIGVVLGVMGSRRRIPAPLVAVGAAMALVGGPLLSRLTTISGSADIESINAARTSLSTANSGFATTVYSSPADLVTSLPSTFPRALIGPYPQDLVHLPQTSLVDWLGWMVLLYMAWRGFRWAEGRGRWLVVAPVMAILVVIAMTSGNYGTMVRLRATPAVLLVPLAAAGTQRKPKKIPPPKVGRAPMARTPRDRRLLIP